MTKKTIYYLAVIITIFVCWLYANRFAQRTKEKIIDIKVSHIHHQIDKNERKIDRKQKEYNEQELKLMDIHSEAEAIRAENEELELKILSFTEAWM